MKIKTYRRLARACWLAALVFSWLCGACFGALLHARWAQADTPTAREQQIERYEEMGR